LQFRRLDPLKVAQVAAFGGRYTANLCNLVSVLDGDEPRRTGAPAPRAAARAPRRRPRPAPPRPSIMDIPADHGFVVVGWRSNYDNESMIDGDVLDRRETVGVLPPD
jgi:hypothetical protein